jgi:hypothetical protein
MPISRERSFAFVHVPRTSGTSIIQALRAFAPDMELCDADFLGIRRIGELCDILIAHPKRRWLLDRIRELNPIDSIENFHLQHLPAIVLRALVGAKAWSELYSFAFVRNPWDLLVSYYLVEMRELSLSPQGSNPDRAAILRRCKTFDDFVGIFPILTVRDMSTMLEDERGNIIVDFIGRFENLSSDWAKISEKIGMPRNKLPHVHGAEHRHYREYYTPRTRRLVAAYFKRDIERFGYSF